jgi:hypothetical protein
MVNSTQTCLRLFYCLSLFAFGCLRLIYRLTRCSYCPIMACTNCQHPACKASKQCHPLPACRTVHARKAACSHCNAPLLTCRS